MVNGEIIVRAQKMVACLFAVFVDNGIGNQLFVGSVAIHVIDFLSAGWLVVGGGVPYLLGTVI